MRYRRHWLALLLVLGGSFSVLGAFAPRIRSAAPPIPDRVVGPRGETVLDGAAIQRGQNVWQALGGQEVGSIWGHGAYVAPDWTADWLHREATYILDRFAHAEGRSGWASLPAERRAALEARLEGELRTNTFDPASGVVRVSGDRAAAFEANLAHYADVFGAGRDAYAIPAGALDDPARARDLAAFFWWTSWAAVTTRPGTDVTYTMNWPHEPLVGNRPTGTGVVWSVISFVLLLAGLLSLLPVGILQTWASVEVGTWWARSSEFLKTPLMDTLRWLRVPGDTLFAFGALVLGWFVLGLATGWSLEEASHVDPGSTVVEGGRAPQGSRA